MAKLLKKLQVTSIDLCKRGANQEAHIMLAKSAEGGDENTQYEEIGKAVSYALGIKPDAALGQQLELMNKAMIESEKSIKADSRLGAAEKDRMLKKSIGEYGDALINLLKAKAPKGADDEEDDEDTPEDEDEPDEEGGDEPAGGGGKEKDVDAEGDMSKKKGACKKVQKFEVDVEKMSPEDKAALEAIKAKYADGGSGGEMHPEVKKAIGEVAELRKELEMAKLLGVAKQYAEIGKKPEELAAKLYEIKKSGDENYNAYIALLDEIKKAAEQSGLFKELGSNRSGALSNDLAAAVAEVRKANPNMSQAEAVVKAYELNPELSEV